MSQNITSHVLMVVAQVVKPTHYAVSGTILANQMAMTTSSKLGTESELTERIHTRVKEASLLSKYNAQSENQYNYQPDLFIPKWSNSARIAVSVIGISSLGLAFRAKGISKKLLATFGIATVVRAVSNLHVTDLVGALANPVIRLRRSIEIGVPMDRVYNFLIHFSNYPRFMSYVQKVEVNDTGGLRWNIRGPGGVSFHWDTSVGKLVSNQTISWKSSLNSPIRNSGIIQFLEAPGGRTQLNVELNYAPPVGALGYAVAHFIGFDPKDKIDEDLNVLKNILEEKFLSERELYSYHKA
jgi:uncharacterized membrane protein